MKTSKKALNLPASSRNLGFSVRKANLLLPIAAVCIVSLSACGSGSSATDELTENLNGVSVDSAVSETGDGSGNETSQPDNEQATTETASVATGTTFTSTSTTGFQATLLDDGSVEIVWPAPENAKGYNIYKDAEYHLSVSTAKFVDTDVTDGSHYYEIVAYDAADNFDTVADGLTVNLSESLELGAALSGDVSVHTPASIADDYDLVFREEFDGPTLDTAKWNTSYLWGADLVINNEEQYYVDIKNEPDFGFDPFRFDDGLMTIESIRTPDNLLDKANGQPYLSGVITSYDSFQFTYGYAEARMKVPYGKGFWAAFWLLNAYYVEKKPEIDIMEHIGDNRDVVYHTYHYYDENGALHSTESMNTNGIDFTGAFHTFAVEWTPGKIVYYVDGVERHTISDPNVSSQSMYLIANTAVGGWWPGSPEIDTPFPANFQIDYIRAYQKRGGLDDQPLNDGSTTIPLADDTNRSSPNHIPPFSEWPIGYPERPPVVE